MDKGKIVLQLNLWNLRKRVWNPRRRSGRKASGVASTQASSQHGHDRPGRVRRASLPRCLDADTYPFHHAYSFFYAISLNKPWSTAQNPAHFPDSSFWESWSQLRPGSSLDLSLIQYHPSQLSTLPSGSPFSPSLQLCIWFPPWVLGLFRLTLKEEICSRFIPLPCMSFCWASVFCGLNEVPFKSREPGSRMRFSIHTVLDSFHPIRLFQCLRRSLQQPAEIRTWSCNR